ncbi:putative hemolysin [Nakamurella sp. UYEF19]|uniref:GNAT family N-acetyltransferase n=1 Tax=Nakamurella sp. UYEF19 TaxID=1756392 RepID=UPI0033925AB9
MTTSELLLETADPGQPNATGYRVTLAADAIDVIAAQQLRYDVFTRECGAVTPGPDGLDVDRFDDLCDHLIVRRRNAEIYPRGEVVATYRLLPPHAHDTDPRSNALYSHTEFDLSALERLLDSTVEAGRSCVAAEHRGAAPISLLWGGIARYMQLTGYRYLMGCASVGLADGGGNAAAFADLVLDKHLAPADLRCRPHLEFVTDGIPRPRRAVVPPLLRGYLRLGAVVCGPPAFDNAFGTADFLVLLDMQRLDPRYARFFLGDSWANAQRGTTA